jgi:hypothetical protein
VCSSVVGFALRQQSVEIEKYLPYNINWEMNIVIVRFLGTFNLKEKNNATIAILDVPQFESVKYIIWDLSGISEQNMTEDEAVLAFIQDKLISSRLTKAKMALLAQDEHVRRICDK